MSSMWSLLCFQTTNFVLSYRKAESLAEEEQKEDAEDPTREPGRDKDIIQGYFLNQQYSPLRDIIKSQ